MSLTGLVECCALGNRRGVRQCGLSCLHVPVHCRIWVVVQLSVVVVVPKLALGIVIYSVVVLVYSQEAALLVECVVVAWVLL